MATEEENVVVHTTEGLFLDSLKRSNTKIKEDRAEGISEDAEIAYETKVKNLRMEIKKLNRKRNNMLDLSPTNADSLMLGDDFNSLDFVERDIKIGTDLRNLQIQLDIAELRFKQLFNKEV